MKRKKNPLKCTAPSPHSPNDLLQATYILFQLVAGSLRRIIFLNFTAMSFRVRATGLAIMRDTSAKAELR